MALARLKTWIAGEVLTASDLNAEFNNIIDNLSFSLSSQFANGTLANPSIAFVNDTNTGAYLAGVDQMELVAGGATAFRLIRLSSGTAFASFARRAAGGERFYPALTWGGLPDDGINSLAAGQVDVVVAGRVAARASAYTQGTNFVVFVPGQAGTPAVIDTAGGDTNVPLLLRAKGTGYVQASRFVFEPFAATQSSYQAGRAYWQTTEGALHIDAGTLIARVPAIQGLQEGTLIHAVHANGATAYAQVARPPVEFCRLVRETNTKLNLSSGYLPLKVGGVWVRRDVHDAVELLAPAVSSNTLYYIYAADSSGSTILEHSTTAHVAATQHGVRVKSGDETRTLVGAAFAGTAGVFSDSAAARMTASWFNRPGKTLQVTTASVYQTSQITYVEPDSALRGQFITWGEDIDATLGGGDIRNDTANGFIFVAIGAGRGTTLNQACDGAGGGQSAGAGTRFFYIAKASTTYTEGTGYFTPLFRVNTGNGVWVASSSPEKAVLSAKLNI